jgi:propanol-preferring alcohol dehydrogenase
MKAKILDNRALIDKKPLVLKKLPDPYPKGYELIIKNVACGVCRTDIHFAEGDLPLRKLPLIFGQKVTGIVNEISGKVKLTLERMEYKIYIPKEIRIKAKTVLDKMLAIQ